MKRVLIVEDDPTLQRGLKDNFARRQFETHVADDGEAGLQAALDLRPDLIILDLMLPKMNGYEVCKTLRDEGFDTPIIMLTAKSEESDIVLGLNLGADDYMTKPFSIRELIARAHAVMRRRRPVEKSNGQVLFGDFLLDRTARRLHRQNEVIDLTPKEFRLLDFLVSNAGKAVSRNEILRAVWGYSIFVTDRSVDRCVTTLRGKIEEDSRRPVYIQTVRELGYRFELPEPDPSE